MASVFEYERDAVRVKARYVMPSSKEEVLRKFSVDPNLTSFEILRTILSRAFEVCPDEFRLNYQFSEDQWFPLLSDWDLDAAIISASDPVLQLELVQNRTVASRTESTETSSSGLNDREDLDDDAIEEIISGNEYLSVVRCTSDLSSLGSRNGAEETGQPGQAGQQQPQGYGGFLPSPEALQSLVNQSNQAIMKQINHTIPALTKRLHKALNPVPAGDQTLVNASGSPEHNGNNTAHRDPGGTSPSSHASQGTSPSSKIGPRHPSGHAVKFSCRHRPPLSDKEFRSFLDNVGELIRPRELRLAVYYGGVEPQLRKVVWKHLLGVYPEGLCGQERMEYMRKKSGEYDQLKRVWWKGLAPQEETDAAEAQYRSLGSFSGGCEDSSEIRAVTNMVRKDVLRTDRHHRFYSGDGNENVNALFNILTTYALNHPSVGYCQGMSDLLSPILVTMMDEAHAYVCFCATMQRLKANFLLDGLSMTKKFQHLTDGLLYYDPEFFAFLKLNQADDLLFCYRWLLLEMKREFEFDDCFKVLETLWSSLPPHYPDRKSGGLPLFETKFVLPQPPQPLPVAKVQQGSDTTLQTAADKKDERSRTVSESCATKRKETAYTKLAMLRRQSSSTSAKSIRAAVVAATTTTRNGLQHLARELRKEPSPRGRLRSADGYKDLGENGVRQKGATGEGQKKFVLDRPPSSLAQARRLKSSEEFPVPGGKVAIGNAHEVIGAPGGSQPKDQGKGSPLQPSYQTKITDFRDFLKLAPSCDSERDGTTGKAKDSVANGKDIQEIGEGASSEAKETGGTNPGEGQKIIGDDDVENEDELGIDGDSDDNDKGLSDNYGDVDDDASGRDEDVVGYSHFNMAVAVAASGQANSSSALSGLTNNGSLTLTCDRLPEPTEFGDGNPFLIFLCVACLLQHRSHIMQQQFDYQEIAMYFDRMVRRHNVERTLAIARKLFAEYLNDDWAVSTSTSPTNQEKGSPTSDGSLPATPQHASALGVGENKNPAQRPSLVSPPKDKRMAAAVLNSNC